MIRLLTLAVLALVAIAAAACSPAAAAPGSPVTADPDALQISARDIRFSTSTLTAPADEAFQIVFDNQEAAPHNVSIYKDEGLSQAVFVKEPFGGPRSEVYEVPALAAGSYTFVCDVHKEMRGVLTVE
jgi:plastocyanin